MAWKSIILILACLGVVAVPLPARAEFIITSAIVEFIAGGPAQADIEVVSRGKDTDYIIANVDEVLHPGSAEETRRAVTDPAAAGLIVTPGRIVLPGGARKIVRFVLMRPPDADEHIYRVDLKPVVKGVDNSARIGLKILVGYEVLVIVRPAQPHADYSAQRSGRTLSVANRGNTDILFENGSQ